jgi:hypothetical protein
MRLSEREGKERSKEIQYYPLLGSGTAILLHSLRQLDLSPIRELGQDAAK